MLDINVGYVYTHGVSQYNCRFFGIVYESNGCACIFILLALISL
jgi:hypothetical protein